MNDVIVSQATSSAPAPVFFILAIVALMVVAVVLSMLMARARRDAVHKWATAHGLHFDPGHDHTMQGRFAQFPCLRGGDERYAYNICHGHFKGRPVWAFDYCIVDESRDSDGDTRRSEKHFSAVVVESPFHLKALRIRPEGFFDRVKETLGFDDIDFESAEFSRRFHVSSPDKRWAYAVLHPRTIEFLLATRQGLSFHLEDRALIVFKNARFEIVELEDGMRILAGILDRLPEYVMDDLTGGSRSSIPAPQRPSWSNTGDLPKLDQQPAPGRRSAPPQPPSWRT